MTVLKKAIIMSILIVITLFFSNQYVKAAPNDTLTFGGTEVNNGPSGGEEPSGPGGGDMGNNNNYPENVHSSANCSCDGGTCTTDSSIFSRNFYVSANLYDAYNKNFDDYMLKNTKIIAGTAIGANLYETRTVYWRASSRVEHNCSCHKRVIAGYVVTCSKKYGCTSWPYYDIERWTEKRYSWNSGCQAQANIEGYNKAKNEVEKNGASYSLSVTDPNEARCGNYDKYRSELENEGYECQNYNITAVPGKTTSYNESLMSGGKVTKEFYYEMYGACINIKTGKVRYLYNGDTCNEDKEYYIENDDKNLKERHWHIFTPLNTKTIDGYILALTPNNKTIQSVGICQDIIERYSQNNEYMLYIKPAKGSFVGNKKIDKQKVSTTKGCITQTILKINTTQKFYGEEITEDSDILKGFNFYYRPIDIDNPFPNGINDDSYWKTWYDTEKKEPNLKESFKEVTYWTNNIDLNSIREYNEENSYLDWETMNIDGTSSFISTQGIINRSSTINKNSVYNLGCAPTNMCEYYIKDGEKVENPVYQPECKNAKIGVSCP